MDQMRRLLLFTLLSLGLAGGTVAHPGLAQPTGQSALVRVDLRSFEDLVRVDALGLPVIAHLTGPDADYLLAVLTPRQQGRLQMLGLPLTVLDPRASDATYYLIESGRPEMTERIASALIIVHDDGRHAIGRLREGAVPQAAESLGVPVAPLGPDPIVLIPRATGDIPTVPAYDPLVANLLAQVTTDAVYAYDGGLSGEWPVQIGGAPYTLATRYSYSGVPIARATQYVYEHLQALGYAASYHNYTLSGYSLRNVIGEKQGLVHPDQIVLLAAHLDCRAAVWPHNPAPGADDNASGSAALMIAADLLADLDFEYTVRIVFFTGEEQGMWGSYYYAGNVASAGEDILAVVNLDMIAWDAKSGPDIDLHSQLPGVEDDSDDLADLFAAVVGVYGLDLVPQIVENGARFSDHSRFWDRGYAAIMAIEDFYNSDEVAAEPRDWNANYHSVNDRLSTLNLAYFREVARAGLATVAHLARPMRTIIGTVTSAETGASLTATVVAAGDGGEYWSETSASGDYAIRAPAGRYTVTASAHGYAPQAATGVDVLTGAGIRLDFALAPMPAFVVDGIVADAVSGLPISATVRFDDGPLIDAPDGVFSTTVLSGTHLVTVIASFHYPVTRAVVVDRDQRQDFELWPTPCLLLVDDDYDDEGNPFDDQVFYTSTLDSLHIAYDLWQVPDDADGPPLEVLARYRGVIWLTGRDWDTTLTAADQDRLAAYLEGGGPLFVSGQDIGWDLDRQGPPPFYGDYLHATYLDDNSGYRELSGVGFLSGIDVTIEGGDGADNQEWPSAVGIAGDGVGVFRYPDARWGAIASAEGPYRVVYFAFGFEGINDAADRRAVMHRVLDYLAPCAIPPPYGFTTSYLGIGFEEAGETVTHSVTIVNSGFLSDAYDLALGAPVWMTTLPPTRSELLAPGSPIAVPLAVTIPAGATVGDHDQVTLTVTSVHSPALTASVAIRTAIGLPVYVPLIVED